MDKDAKQKFDELLKKLEDEQKLRKDIPMPLNTLRVNDDFTFRSEETGRVEFTDFAFNQLCQQVTDFTLPADYFKKLYKAHPEKAVADINWHLENGKGATRKLRLTGNEVRGIVSEQYIPYDNLDALTLFMDTAKREGFNNFELKNDHLSDKIMFLRFTFPDTAVSLGRTIDGKDDKNFLALDLLNSEVGSASIIVNPSIWRLVCTNGMVEKKAQYGLFKQRHINFDPATVNSRIQNSIVTGIKTGEEILDKFGRSRNVKIQNPYEVITHHGQRKAYSDKILKGLRESFEKEPENNLYGVVNAFTRTAQNLGSIERKIEMEQFASKILDEGLGVRA